MTLIDQIVGRLQSVSSLLSVEHAWATRPVDDIESSAPAAFVFPMRETAGGNVLDIGVRQLVTSDVAVFVVARASILDAVRADIFGALLGWQPSGYDIPMTLVSGEIEEIKGDYIWWRDVYRTSRLIGA